MSDTYIRGLAVVFSLMIYVLPLMIVGAIIEWRIEKKERRAAERMERNRRRREREIQIAGQRLMDADERRRILNEPPVCGPKKKSPLRKVCGVYSNNSEALELWK